MSENKTKIAYIAPEIPALSATFVYNEIFEMEKNGFIVYPFSVHKQSPMEYDENTKKLLNKTKIIYNKNLFFYLRFNLQKLFTNPFLFIKTLLIFISDLFKCGISRNSLGLIYRFIVSSYVSTIITKEKITHIHIHFSHVPCDIGMYVSLLSGISYSFTSHANDIFERCWLLKEKVNRSKFSVTVSNFNRKFINEKYLPKKNIYAYTQ